MERGKNTRLNSMINWMHTPTYSSHLLFILKRVFLSALRNVYVYIAQYKNAMNGAQT